MELQEPTPNSLLCAAYPKLKAQTLREQELCIEHIGGLEFGEFGYELVDQDGVVGRFGCEKEACRPGILAFVDQCRSSWGHDSSGGAKNSHDCLWVPLHDAVLEIEPLHITDRRGLDYLWQTKALSAYRGYLDTVEAQQEEFVRDR